MAIRGGAIRKFLDKSSSTYTLDFAKNDAPPLKMLRDEAKITKQTPTQKDAHLETFVWPSLYFSASNPTRSNSIFAAILSFLADPRALADKMLYLRSYHGRNE